MSYGLHIGELVSTQLAELDEIAAELLFLELMGLAADPYRGTEIRRVEDRSRRLLMTGQRSGIVFEVDESAKSFPTRPGCHGDCGSTGPRQFALAEFDPVQGHGGG